MNNKGMASAIVELSLNLLHKNVKQAFLDIYSKRENFKEIAAVNRFIKSLLNDEENKGYFSGLTEDDKELIKLISIEVDYCHNEIIYTSSVGKLNVNIYLFMTTNCGIEDDLWYIVKDFVNLGVAKGMIKQEHYKFYKVMTPCGD